MYYISLLINTFYIYQNIFGLGIPVWTSGWAQQNQQKACINSYPSCCVDSPDYNPAEQYKNCYQGECPETFWKTSVLERKGVCAGTRTESFSGATWSVMGSGTGMKLHQPDCITGNLVYTTCSGTASMGSLSSSSLQTQEESSQFLRITFNISHNFTIEDNFSSGEFKANLSDVSFVSSKIDFDYESKWYESAWKFCKDHPGEVIGICIGVVGLLRGRSDKIEKLNLLR